MPRYERVMKKANKFYNNPKSEECFALDSNIIAFLIPRLEMLMKDSDSIIEWDIKIKEDIYKVIDNLTTIKNFESETVEDTKKYIKLTADTFTVLGRVFPYLWW